MQKEAVAILSRPSRGVSVRRRPRLARKVGGWGPCWYAMIGLNITVTSYATAGMGYWRRLIFLNSPPPSYRPHFPDYSTPLICCSLCGARFILCASSQFSVLGMEVIPLCAHLPLCVMRNPAHRRLGTTIPVVPALTTTNTQRMNEPPQGKRNRLQCRQAGLRFNYAADTDHREYSPHDWRRGSFERHDGRRAKARALAQSGAVVEVVRTNGYFQMSLSGSVPPRVVRGPYTF